MPDGGSINARLTRQGKLLRLTLEDSGSGIAEAVRATLFQRYQRQPGIEDSRNGLGLGLAIVRSVAANHGGTVLVSPTHAGGTRITLTISIRQNEEAVLRSPLRRPDYTGGWDHALIELSDCLDARWYEKL
jgi:signal transduction histidine kinase